VTGVTDARAGRVAAPQRRWPLVLVMALGVGLALVPVGSRMFDRAPQGERMIAAFKPYMTTAKIEAFQRDIALVEGYAREIDGPLPQALHPGARTPESARAALLRERPELALFAQQWPREHRTFVEMLGAMHASRDGYDGVAALPRFGLFPYFLLIAGALLALLAAAGLLLARRAAWLPVQRAVIGLGVALALAPVTLQLFERGPKGADMVEAFRPIENRARVQQVQSSFGTITLGHGAIADALEPALRKGGRSEREIKQDFPAMVELGKRWVPILNAFTPMIGVMSDSVGDYEAVAALPSFRLFPWFFLIPGLAAAALVALCSPAGRRRLPLLARETTEGA
jgi:hypothetical protein